MGTLENTRAESLESFGEGVDVFYNHIDDHGLWRVSLGDASTEKLFDKKYSLLDVSQDRSAWIFSDADLNFYLQTVGDTKPQKIRVFEGLLGEAAIAPDASRVALTRIRDLNAPTDEMGDGRIYFLNLTDLQITHVETPIDSFIVSLFWSRDGEALLVSTFDNKYWRIDPRSGAATEIPYEAFGGQFYPKAGGAGRVSCPGDGGGTLVAQEWGADEGIGIERPDGTSSPLVTISGRERGFHDYQATVSHFFYLPSCENVIFSYDTRVWIVSVESLQVYQVASGRYPFMLPELIASGENNLDASAGF